MKRLIAATAVLFGIACAPASAATITVTITNDDYEVGSGCSLREAVEAANGIVLTNLGCAPGDAGLDTILLTPGLTYELDRHNAPEDANLYGDLDIKDPVTIKTNGALATIDGGKTDPDIPAVNNDRVIQTHDDSDAVTLERLRITNGREHAGGLASGGGGIRSDDLDDPLTVIDSEIVGNEVSDSDGSPQFTWGGGIFAYAGSVSLIRSTVANNTLKDNGEESSNGGGIALNDPADLTAINSTISGNKAEENVGVNTEAHGGGIFAYNGDVTLTNVTVTNNTAESTQGTGTGGVGGGIYDLSELAPITLDNSIVAGNTTTGAHADCNNLVLAPGDFNLVGACTVTGAGNLTGASAGLGLLGANGGPTRTHALLSGSLAINHGGSCPATDQRGIARPQGGACDTGAFEVEVAAAAPPSAGAPPAAATGQRAAALKKCKKKKGRKRKKCRKKALKLPV